MTTLFKNGDGDLRVGPASTLASGVAVGATSMTVAAGTGNRFPVVAAPDVAYVTLENTTNVEIIKIAARALGADTMTIVKAQEGTTDRAWLTGDVVSMRLTAAQAESAVNAQAVALAALTAHVDDTADAHDASAISYAGGTGISATDVEGALDELATEKSNTGHGHAAGEITGLGSAAAKDTGTTAGTVPLVGTKSATELLAGLVELSNATEAPDRTKADVVLTPATLRDALAAQNDAPIYACRAWVNFNGTGTPAVNASGNVSSITDNGTGDYTINFTTAMPDANYHITGFATSDNTSAANQWGLVTSRQPSEHLAGSVRVTVVTSFNATTKDYTMVSVGVIR